MSQLEELSETVANTITHATEAHTYAANADELCARIVVGGQALGFGNDPALITAAHDKVATALSGLFTALADLEQAQTFINQALET